jgi:choline dehydrogenase-like flavoprotein
MFIEATTLEDDQVAQSEVCILGGGPAGLSLARRLIDAGKRVVVLEAGGLTFDPDSQVFYIGETIGETYFDLDVARLRALGGSMGHWAGACRPLEAWDFEDKPAYRAGGWPIGRADLDPWLQDTAALLEIPSDFTDFSVTDDLRLSGFQWSQMNFGFHWYDWAEAEPNLRIYLNSAAVNLVPGGSGIRAVEVMSGPPWASRNAGGSRPGHSWSPWAASRTRASCSGPTNRTTARSFPPLCRSGATGWSTPRF